MGMGRSINLQALLHALGQHTSVPARLTYSHGSLLRKHDLDGLRFLPGSLFQTRLPHLIQVNGVFVV